MKTKTSKNSSVQFLNLTWLVFFNTVFLRFILSRFDLVSLFHSFYARALRGKWSNRKKKQPKVSPNPHCGGGDGGWWLMRMHSNFHFNLENIRPQNFRIWTWKIYCWNKKLQLASLTSYKLNILSLNYLCVKTLVFIWYAWYATVPRI